MTPKLRFPEFNDEWHRNILGDIADFLKGNGISKDDMIEGGTMRAIRYGELYTTYHEVIRSVYSMISMRSKGLVLSNANDIIIPASGETNIDIAKASCVLCDGIALGGDINIIRSKQNGIFLSYYLNNVKKKDISRLAQGVSVVHLYSSNLKLLELNLPTLLEQQKIADFLTAVDNRIELISKKVELLKQYKKGAMQKIFTQQIRFMVESGSHYPDWHKKPLGKISKITTGKLDANAMELGGQYRFYTCAKDYYFINKYAFDTEALLVSGNGANVGYIHYFNGKFNAYQRTYVLDKFSENIKYIQYFLGEKLGQRIDIEKKDGNTPYIVLGTLADMDIHLPESQYEQQKIADFIAALEGKVNLLEKELEQSKQFKKGLLQRMFV